MTRSRTEAAIAILIVAGMLVAGGAALIFVFTISPVHRDPTEVPSRLATPPAPRHAQAIAAAQDLARALMVDGNLPGLSMAVAVDGELAWAEGFGVANVERRDPVTPDTRFRLGSVSKTLAAAGAALLHERGQLELDAPVQQYVPAFPAKAWTLTTRDLLGDVGGVHRLRDGHERIPTGTCQRVADALQPLVDEPLAFQPGSQYRFSIYGWILVSAVIEGAAGETFPTFLARELFAPLGMQSTVLDGHEVPGRTSFYFPRMAQRPDLGLQDAPPANYSCFAAAGAFLSTPSDMVRLATAMLKPGFLTAQTLAQFQAPLRLASGATSEYALGWKVEQAAVGGRPTRVLSHRGSPMGGGVVLVMAPDMGLAVAVMTNVSYAEGVEPFSRKVADAFADH